MRDQEIIGLEGAYSSIYTQTQELTEEVEIATQYFYEMGLNEDGVDILIEELGLEEFSNFVYDIAEDYILTEARAGGAKIEPKLASGKEIKGKPKAASLKRLRAQKAARQEAENKASESKPSGMTAALRSQATKKAAEKQPEKKSTPTKTKQGIASKIGSALKRAGEDIAITYKVAREVGKRAENSAPVKKFWGMKEEKDATEIGITGLPIPKKKRSPAKQYEFEKKRRKNIGTNVGGEKYKKDVNPHLNPRSVREEVLSYLLDEGFASDEKSAEAIMDAMSEAWVESIVEEILDEEKKEFPSDKVNNKAAKHDRDYLKRPNSYVGQSSKLKSKKMRAIKSTVDAGDDPRNTMHGQDLRKIKTRPSMG